MKSLFTKIFGRILRVWRLSATSNALFAWFFGVLFAICIFRALIGAVPTFAFGHDNFFFFENGWRALYGLRPHLDFWSSWGPLSFLLVALGLKLSNGSPNGLAYSNAILTLVVGLWTYRVGRDRLAQVPCALLALYTSLLVCSPHPIGLWPMVLSPAMAYNRYGYALLVLVLIECFQPTKASATSVEEWVGSVSTGAAIGLALFLKASFSLAGMGLVAVSLVLWLPSVRRLLGIVAGFAGVSLLGVAYLRFQLPAMVRALRMAASARSQNISLRVPVHNIAHNLTPFFCVLILAMAASFLKTRRSEWLGDLYLPVAAVIVYIADIALLSTNAQTSGLPLLGAFALLVADRLADVANTSPVASQEYTLAYCATLLLLAGILFLPQFTSDALALPIAAVRKLHPPPSCSVRFTVPRIASLMLCDYPDEDETQAWSNGKDYTTYVNDGVVLLRQYANPSDKVLTMDMQDPFPYVLGWAPPRGGFASTAFNFTFSARFRPTIDQYFGDASVVMIPKHPAFPPEFATGFYQIYEPAVEQRYALAAESDWFRLYKKK